MEAGVDTRLHALRWSPFSTDRISIMYILGSVRQPEKTLHFINSTAFLGCSAFRFILECSVTRKKHCSVQNAAFYIFDFLLYFEIQCVLPKLCIRQCRVSKHCFWRVDPYFVTLQWEHIDSRMRR